MGVRMDIEQRYELITRNTLEVVDEESLRALLAEKEHPRLYIGFEPSGLCHLGWMLVANKVKDYIEAGLEVIIFFADWHAQINGKLGGSLENIQLCAEYMKDSFESLGVPRDKVKFVMASEILDLDYWATVIKIGSETSVARVKRAMTIMGRKAENDEIRTSMMLYPLMTSSRWTSTSDTADSTRGGPTCLPATLPRSAAGRLPWPSIPLSSPV